MYDETFGIHSGDATLRRSSAVFATRPSLFLKVLNMFCRHSQGTAKQGQVHAEQPCHCRNYSVAAEDNSLTTFPLMQLLKHESWNSIRRQHRSQTKDRSNEYTRSLLVPHAVNVSGSKQTEMKYGCA